MKSSSNDKHVEERVREDSPMNEVPSEKNDFADIAEIIRELKQQLAKETDARIKAENAFHQQTRFIKAIIDVIPDTIYAKDASRRKLLSNKADLDIIGKPESEVVGKTDMEVFNPELAREFEKDDNLVLEKGIPVINRESLTITKTGKHLWLLTTKVPFYDDGGKIAGLVGIGRDISDRKKAENKLKERERSLEKQNEEYLRLNKEYQTVNRDLVKSLEHIRKMNQDLKAAKEKAEISDKLKSAFLANMSHEIRTPMNAIIGFSSFLAQKEIDNAKKETFIQIIKSSCEQLLAIINDIIDISKIEADQINLSRSVFNLNDIFRELYLTFKEEVCKKCIDLKEPEPAVQEPFLVYTDKNRLRQVLINLLNNAIKFTSKGQIEFGYKVGKNNCAEIWVKDSGIGIAKKYHTDVFKRFWQVDSSATREHGGTGLGLAISKALVEKMGGRIGFESKKGSGSKFWFTVPITEDLTYSADPVRSGRSVASPARIRLHKILIAEDELNNLLFIMEFLSGSNIKIVHASNGREAVASVHCDPEIDLVLMDLKMPVMDGFEAMREIKKNRPELPVIAVTAYAMSEDREKALASGFDNYISKPVDTDELLRILSLY